MSNEKKVEDPLISLGPIPAHPDELQRRAHLGEYYPCINGVKIIPTRKNTKTTTDFFDTFPKPIGFLAMPPDWVTEGELEISLLGDEKYHEKHYDASGAGAARLREAGVLLFTCEFLRNFRNSGGRSFTEQELKKLIEDNIIIKKRMRGTPIMSHFESYSSIKINGTFDNGTNPVGVREFFESQVFLNPPTVKFSPALLKPYLVKDYFIQRLTFDNVYLLNPNGNDDAYAKFPVALYSGIFHGNTCCGDVFDEMDSREEFEDEDYSFISDRKRFTFDTKKERIAFFLKICKMLIDGIEKDGESDDKKKECENHGNYGNTLVGLFDIEGDYFCSFLHNFMRNYVVILLFYKLIEKNDELKKIIYTQKSMTTTDLTGAFKNKAFSIQTLPDADRKPVFEGHMTMGIRSDKQRVQRFLPTIDPSIARKYEVKKPSLIALLERYFSIILLIMSGRNANDDANPLNVVLCREDLLKPYEFSGLVHSAGELEHPLYPPVCDGKTMAHLLAERCPSILMRIIHVNPEKNNPIAYLIADERGETPKSIAIRELQVVLKNPDSLPDMIEKAMRAMTFFNSLPDRQPDVEEYNIKAEQKAEYQAKKKAKKEAKKEAQLKAVMGYDMAKEGPAFDTRFQPLTLQGRRIFKNQLETELGQGGRRSRKKNNRNKKRVKTLNKKKYRLSRMRRCKNKK